MLAAALAAALSACAAQQPGAPEAAAPAASEAALVYFTAAPGDVMLLSDPCAAAPCAPPAAMTELVYVGMRSPTEAVFRRREVALHSGPVTPTAIPGLFVPERAEVTTIDGPFVTDRRGPADSVEIVVNPVAGVEFGVEEIVVDISSVTPGRVVYLVRRV